MYFKQKITYMVIGCLFTLAGYFLATLGVGGFIPQNASAQADGKQIVDEIFCRGLWIVNAEGKIIAGLVAEDGKGGALKIFNEIGNPVAVLSAIDEGGNLNIANKIGNPAVGLMAEDEGGSLNIFGMNRNKSGARLSANKNGGVLTVKNKERSRSFY